MEGERPRSVSSRIKRTGRVVLSEDESDEPSPQKRIRSSSRGHVSDDDLDNPTDDGAPQRGQKKSRVVNGNGVRADEDDDDDHGPSLNRHADGDGDEEAIREEVRRSMRFRPEYDRGSDNFVAGSVVRIKMHNFMAYDNVEFRPGPHLNMILGPNGTGKSTIAAAIALGLAFPQKVMGRANDLKSYVKQGTEAAETEIELKGKKGKRNLVIWRRIHREDEKSEYKLNGEPATMKAVREKVAAFGVQANNLCSFLPQDKVAEFAKMNHPFALQETMRAAGHPKLSEWHESLIEKGAKQKDVEGKLVGQTEKRDRLQSQVDRLEPEVSNFNSRIDKEQERERCLLLVHFGEHRDLYRSHDEAKASRTAVKDQIKALTYKRRPLLHLAEKQHEHRAKAEAAIIASGSLLSDQNRTMKVAARDLVKIATDGQDIDNDLSALKKKLKRHEEDKNDCRSRMKKAQEMIDRPRKDLSDVIKSTNEERREVSRRHRAAVDAVGAVGDQQRASQVELDNLVQQIEASHKRLQGLQSVEARREAEARNLDPSIGYALDWLARNGDKLEQQVHRPPMISVNVPRREVAWQIEMCTSLVHRKTFICQTRHDYDLLLGLNNTQVAQHRRPDNTLVNAFKVGLQLAHVEATEENCNPQRPCSSEQLEQLGFLGFAIDFVDAPPAVMAFLNNYAGLHQAAISQRPSSAINSRAVMALGIRSWVTQDDHNSAIRSKYGKRDSQMSSRAKVPARAFSLAVDQQAVQQKTEEIANFKTKQSDLAGPHQALVRQHEEARKQTLDLKDRINGLDRKLEQLREENQTYAKAKIDFDKSKDKLARLEEQPSPDEQRNKLKRAKLKYAKSRAKTLGVYQSACEETLDIATGMIRATLRTMQFQTNCDMVDRKQTEGDESTKELEEELGTLVQTVAELSTKTKQSMAAFTQRVSEAPRDVAQQVKTMVEAHLEHQSAKKRGELSDESTEIEPTTVLKGHLQQIEADLALSVNIDGNVVARYHRLSEELNEVKGIVTRRQSDLRALTQSVNKILTNFDPALDELIDTISKRFSTSFAKVGCSGEVRVDRVDGDFAAWGVQILCSFRTGVPLEVLTGSRQSGGERSLATVTYLMSLSEMARVPFSLVDEINQGMDQRAEKAVHNQLVQTTCGTDVGQYFLITPKLLTGLSYHPKMKILTINNGSHLPNHSDKAQRFGSLKSCLMRYQQKHPVAAH